MISLAPIEDAHLGKLRIAFDDRVQNIFAHFVPIRQERFGGSLPRAARA